MLFLVVNDYDYYVYLVIFWSILSLIAERVYVPQWIVHDVRVSIKSLRVTSLPQKNIRAGKPSLGSGIIPAIEVIEARFDVSFLSGELLPHAVAAGVPLRGAAAADRRHELLTKRKIIVSLHVCETACLVQDHARRAELIGDEPLN
jgi:hypothetical protein